MKKYIILFIGALLRLVRNGTIHQANKLMHTVADCFIIKEFFTDMANTKEIPSIWLPIIFKVDSIEIPWTNRWVINKVFK